MEAKRGGGWGHKFHISFCIFLDGVFQSSTRKMYLCTTINNNCEEKSVSSYFIHLGIQYSGRLYGRYREKTDSRSTPNSDPKMERNTSAVGRLVLRLLGAEGRRGGRGMEKGLERRGGRKKRGEGQGEGGGTGRRGRGGEGRRWEKGRSQRPGEEQQGQLVTPLQRMAVQAGILKDESLESL